jgi:hypothetical protein
VVYIPSRRVRFATSPFEAGLAGAAVLTAIWFVASFLCGEDDKSNLSAVVPSWWEWPINLGYGLSGALILYGLWTGKVNHEAAGLVGLAASAGINLTVIAYLRGTAAVASIIAYVAIVLAALARSIIVRKHRHVIALIPERDPT